MKKKNLELNVDFIGEQPSKLTKEEEKAISDYIRSHRVKTEPRKSSKKKEKV